MPMDAAQILRHAISTQYDVAARQGEALDRAAQSAAALPQGRGACFGAFAVCRQGACGPGPFTDG